MKRRPNRATSCTGKKAMLAKEAKAVARAIRERGDRVAPYRCIHCNAWHVGNHLGGERFNSKRPRPPDEDEEGRRYG